MRSCIFLLLVASFALSSCAFTGNSVVKQELAAEYMELADAYVAVRKYDKAAAFYERAGAHKAYYNATRYKLARMYALSGKWVDAAEILEPLYILDPDNLLVSNSYSYALVSLGELEKALPIYERNYTGNSDNPVQARNYAEILFLAKRWDDCTAHIAKMREQFGDAEELSDLVDLEKRIEAAIERDKKEAEEKAKKEAKDKTDDSGSTEGAEATGDTDDTGEPDSSETGETGATAETAGTDASETAEEAIDAD